MSVRQSISEIQPQNQSGYPHVEFIDALHVNGLVHQKAFNSFWPALSEDDLREISERSDKNCKIIKKKILKIH